MKLKCPECNVEAVKRGRAAHWICPECNQVIAEPTEETCLAVQAGEMTEEEFIVHDSCQDCMHFGCLMQPVDAEEKSMKGEMAAMFGDDEEAVEAYWGGACVG